MAFNAMAAAAAHKSAQQLYAHLHLFQTQLVEAALDCMVHLDWQPHHCNQSHEFLDTLKLFTLDICVPWIIINSMSYFQRWKLQSNKISTTAEQWECINSPSPSLETVYRHIHKLHHKYSVPFGLAAKYAHSGEVFIFGTSIIARLIFYYYFTQNLCILTVYIWIMLHLFQAINAHSGYDFLWSLQHIIPFWLGAEHHDFHHMAFTNNYSTSFQWCNHLFHMNDGKVVMKGKRKAKQEAAEHQLIAEIEAEGQHIEAIAEILGKMIKV
ncbi:hypothetical protein HD554DRAFT_2039892 [Boletus coccyginus]|nr:hypothetical protein HD554DRAFT_2039892 [Boletus coccyginus]